MVSLILPHKKPFIRTQNPVLNQESPLSQGLKAWWPYTGSVTSILDRSGNHHDMRHTGATHIGTTTVADFGVCGDFHTDTIQHQFTCSTLDITNFPMTVGAWWSTLNQDATDFVIGWGDGTATNNRSGIGQGAGGTGTLRGTFSEDNTNFAHNFAVEPGLIVFVIASQTDRRLYFNGGLVEDNSGSVEIPTINNFTISGFADSTPNSPFQGVYVDGFVWDRVLTADEIFSLYAPATRWQLHWQPRLYIVIKIPSTAQDIEGSPHTNTSILNHGSLTINIGGSVLENIIIDGNG